MTTQPALGVLIPEQLSDGDIEELLRQPIATIAFHLEQMARRVFPAPSKIDEQQHAAMLADVHAHVFPAHSDCTAKTACTYHGQVFCAGEYGVSRYEVRCGSDATTTVLYRITFNLDTVLQIIQPGSGAPWQPYTSA